MMIHQKMNILLFLLLGILFLNYNIATKDIIISIGDKKLLYKNFNKLVKVELNQNITRQKHYKEYEEILDFIPKQINNDYGVSKAICYNYGNLCHNNPAITYNDKYVKKKKFWHFKCSYTFLNYDLENRKINCNLKYDTPIKQTVKVHTRLGETNFKLDELENILFEDYYLNNSFYLDCKTNKYEQGENFIIMITILFSALFGFVVTSIYWTY